MATRSSVLAWRIPVTGEPGGLLSLGSYRVRHDWSDLAMEWLLCPWNFQTRILEWVAISSSGDLPDPGIESASLALAGGYHCDTWDSPVVTYTTIKYWISYCFKPLSFGAIYYGQQYKTAKSLQLCPTLCDPIDGSPPGSSVPGILQARTLERVAISFSNAWKWKYKTNTLISWQFLIFSFSFNEVQLI